jgi:hypothetical protein
MKMILHAIGNLPSKRAVLVSPNIQYAAGQLAKRSIRTACAYSARNPSPLTGCSIIGGARPIPRSRRRSCYN